MNEKQQQQQQQPMRLIFGGIFNISHTYPLVFMYNNILMLTSDSET